jgi:transcriptional regulator
MYIPKAHRVEDRNFLQDFMDEFSFADLVTSSPTLRITHIPVILDRSAGAYGKLFGHISRQNPQNQAFDGRHTAVIVFRGPHGYISPAWQGNLSGVPTWNFAVVHATGRPNAIAEKTALRKMLARLIEKFETYQGSGYDFSKLPEDSVFALMEGLVGFEMPIELLEGKFKLGQDRNKADQQRFLEQLRHAARPERSLAEYSESFCNHFPPQ